MEYRGLHQAALMADVFTGTILTLMGLPGLMPLPWLQTIIIFSYPW